jgi:tetratricopeptide (TPR) repeat protein
LDSAHRKREDAYNRVDPNQVSSFDFQGIQYLTFIRSILGESPPPPPRACFGRSELIEKIVDFAEHLTPVALIGAGGIGKTSIALTVLHHDRIKEQFGDNRRFIRCDQFPASRIHFLSQLSKVIGAGVENPQDLTPLRPFLSSRKMILLLDNAESILDPHGTNAEEICAVVKELIQFNTVCLCITSRLSTVPPHCKHLIIPTLSMKSACDIFYGIYNGVQSSVVSGLLKQLDFHPLSITLLATVASHNMWDYDQLAREWETHHTQALCTDYNQSLAATIELSLASPMFLKLGPNARDLLGVIAFYPQGVNEDNLDWLFPTLSNTKNIFDKFCVLSLTYRSNGFITMLVPLRDYLGPKDPKLSPLLCKTKECYFSRLEVFVDPTAPGFEESKWIRLEDVNVEHLLNILTSTNKNSVSVWNICVGFMQHLCWHKKRLVVLGPKIEGLPDNHSSKPQCLFHLALLFQSVGDYAESKQLLTHAMKLWRKRWNLVRVVESLRFLSSTNLLLGLPKEGIPQAKEALWFCKWLGHTWILGESLYTLASLLHADNQLDAAEEAVSNAIDFLPGIGEHFVLCKCYRILGWIYYSKGQIEKAISHFKRALEIASSFNWYGQLFQNHYALAELFFKEGRFDDAHNHIEHAKSHAISDDDTYCLGCTMELQAQIWHKEHRLEEAKTGVLGAANVFERLGATEKVENCRMVLQNIEEERLVTSGELLEAVLYPTHVNPLFLAHSTE